MAQPLQAPAADRNKQPILEALARLLPMSGIVLEVASGTGQHVVHFARGLPRLQWQPSDPDPAMRGSIRAHLARASLPNVAEPLDLDVCALEWPVTAAGAVLCINLIHIAPWAATPALLNGAARLLEGEAPLVLYGPYRRDGQHTASSNEAFDASLRARNADWGVRDLEGEVVPAARQAGFELGEVVAMPANNLCVCFRRVVGAEA